jgi:hypothetical protein
VEHPRDEYVLIIFKKHVCPQAGREEMGGSAVLDGVDVDEVSETDEDVIAVVREVVDGMLMGGRGSVLT